MVKILVVKLSDDVGQNEILLKLVSDNRRRRISDYVNQFDIRRSLITDLLIRKVASSVLNTPYSEIRIKYNNYGKPFIDATDCFEFNISHSGSYVIMAISNRRIGIDIEKMDRNDIAIAKRFISPNECKYIYEFDVYNYQRFYRIWTLRESCVKALGIGLSVPFKTYSFICSEIIYRF